MKDNQILSWQSTHYRQNRIRFWDQVASQKRIHGIASAVYYRRLQEIYRFHIPPGLRVIVQKFCVYFSGFANRSCVFGIILLKRV
jgi:hypothetical protein